jgi:SPASM domain peptide maturase of grasp-with-spasm system
MKIFLILAYLKVLFIILKNAWSRLVQSQYQEFYMDDKIFRLHANCIPVKGARRSLLCDLQMGRYDFIPNDLYDILRDHKQDSLEQILDHYGKDNQQVISQYFEYLLDKEYGLWVEEDELGFLTEIDLEYEYPHIVHNAVVDLKDSIHDFDKIFDELDFLGCRHLQVRFFKLVDLSTIDNILAKGRNNRILSIELLVQYDQSVSLEDYKKLSFRNIKITNIIVAGAQKSESESLGIDKTKTIVWSKSKIDNCSSCGVIHPTYFAINMEAFTEARNFNSCLNNKISIDINGDIKNCPSSSESYGNIENKSLIDVIGQKAFKKLWNITKDQVDTCKICEFRYVCTDCRIYISNTNNIYSKPSKCNYDPETATWL